MSPSNAGGPATANGEPALKDDLCSPAKIDPDNKPSASTSQVPPDDCGESDLAFFTKRPGINERVRLPIAGEFPPSVLEPGRCAFVRIRIERDPDGRLKRRARRRLRFCAGGHA